jgi:putative nucleotidyltransferase with HDIG domain
MASTTDIKACFSEELQWIKSDEIKEKIVTVWQKAAEKGGWDKLDDVPFTLLFENSGKLTEHTKRVTHLAKAVIDLREEALNQDYLIAGALLHDVGKMLEYERVNGKIVKGKFGQKFRHPVSGSKLAWQCGIPDEIVHIIYAHSHEGDKTERSPEAFIVHHCDFIDFHIRKSMVNK